MSLALYRKYRPQAWSEVIGQNHVVQTLQNAISSGHVGHAYLFAGPRGTGKTTTARILAKAVNCLAEDARERPCNRCENCTAVNENRFLDLLEMDAASYTGVDDVRELRDKIGFAPSQGSFKVYIIDEVHMLSTPAFNALLKTLEEPPPHAIFVLATTEIHKIPATVLSRCQRHEFRRVPVAEIVANLRRIAKSEGMEVDEEALSLIAHQATGSIRDAQSLLDQLSSVGSKITLAMAETVLGTAPRETVFEVMDAVQERHAAIGMAALRRALDSGADPRTLARQIVEYLRGMMLVQLGNTEQVEATRDVRERMALHATAFSSSDILRMIKAFNHAAAETRGGSQPSLSLELALAETLEPPTEGLTAKPAPAGKPIASSVSTPRRNTEAQTVGDRLGTAAAGSGSSSLSARDVLYQDPGAEAAVEVPVAPASEGNREAGPLTLGQVLRGWKEIRLLIKPAHPGVEALLNSCRPVDVHGDELVLGFQSETVRALMDKPENLDVTRKAIQEILGSPLRIKCAVINARGKRPSNVTEDGMVATALDHGGEIVDLQE
jgi:DNA polymerase-3 subunit gamma/tau